MVLEAHARIYQGVSIVLGAKSPELSQFLDVLAGTDLKHGNAQMGAEI